MHFEIEDFRPKITNPHLQTAITSLFRRPHGITFRRTRIDLPDGDFIDIDYADVAGMTWADLGDDAPIILVLHGLEGDAQRNYCKEIYRQLALQGIRAVGINYRGCSGEPNRSTRTYHGGATDDVRIVQDKLFELYPNVAHGLVGFSLGAGLTLKLLGENDGERSQHPLLKAAAVISPCFDMTLASEVLDHGTGRYYLPRFFYRLRKKLKWKEDQLRDLIDFDKAYHAKTFREFDDACTAPLNGFASADDYYQQNSSGQFLHAIDIPTLLLRAKDDPFFDPADIPYDTIAANPALHSAITELGGHVGFIEGWTSGFWAERQAARFSAQMLGVALAPDEPDLLTALTQWLQQPTSLPPIPRKAGWLLGSFVGLIGLQSAQRRFRQKRQSSALAQ